MEGGFAAQQSRPSGKEGFVSGEYVSPYLRRRLRSYEEVRQKQVSQRVLDAIILRTLSEAKAAGHGQVGQMDLATRAVLDARPDLSALDALEAVERVRRQALF